MQILILQTILNGPSVAPDLITQWLTRYAPYMPALERASVTSAYTTYGELTTIGNVLPFCQAAKETAWFSADRWRKSRNPAGLGATNDGAWGGVFASVSAGIFAQYAHLLTYATTATHQPYATLALFDPRLSATPPAWRGSAKTWPDLNGKWAYPGVGYGESIIQRANVLLR